MEKEDLNAPDRDWTWIDGRAVMKLLGITSNALKKCGRLKKLPAPNGWFPRENIITILMK